MNPYVYLNTFHRYYRAPILFYIQINTDKVSYIRVNNTLVSFSVYFFRVNYEKKLENLRSFKFYDIKK